MNQYTKKEKAELLSNLTKYEEDPIGEVEICMVYRGMPYYLTQDFLYKIFDQKFNALDATNPIVAMELNDLITKTPFRNVPLFINIFPEVASWRLRIAK